MADLSLNGIQNAFNQFNGQSSAVPQKFTTYDRKVITQYPDKAPPPADTGIKPITDFISTIKGVGLAKQNHYTFTMIPPNKVYAFGDGTHGMDLRMLQLLCSSCTLPGVNIDTVQHRTFGEAYQMPNDKTYGNVVSTFYVDGNLDVKKLFDQWSEVIMDPVSRTFNFYSDYTTNIAIIIYDSHGYPHYEVVLEDAYPKSINDITLAYSNHDFMTLDVTWAYRKWSSFQIENSLHRDTERHMGAFNTTEMWSTTSSHGMNTQRSETVHERLMGYVGNFKEYQSRFNNVAGDLQHSSSMLKNKDWGGLVNQTFGDIL